MQQTGRENIDYKVKDTKAYARMVDEMMIIKDAKDVYDAYLKRIRDDEHQARMENLAYETHEKYEKGLRVMMQKHLDDEMKERLDEMKEHLDEMRKKSWNERQITSQE